MVGDIMQPTHLLFVLVVALLVLGPKRLPEVGRQLGNGIRDFRNAINGEHEARHPVVEESFSYRGADDDLTSVAPSDHAFAHETTPTAEPAANAGSAPQRAPAATADAAPGAAGDHEFAHETARSETAGSDRAD